MPVLLVALTDVGWLTGRLLRVTLSSAEWVLWLLLALSVASLAVILSSAWSSFAPAGCSTPRRLPSSSGEEISRRFAGSSKARRGWRPTCSLPD